MMMMRPGMRPGIRYEPNTSPPLQVGQRVLVRAQRRGVAEKLSTRAHGPYDILEAVSYTHLTLPTKRIV